MSRHVITLSREFTAAQFTPKTGDNARRARNLDALLVKNESTFATRLRSRFLPLAAALGLVAGLATALATWKLYHFPH